MTNYVSQKFGEYTVIYFTADDRPAEEKENHEGVALGVAKDETCAVFSIFKQGKDAWVERFVPYDSFQEAYKTYVEVTGKNDST